MTGAIVEHMGGDYFAWASDYPHVDASYGVLDEIKNNIASVSEASKRMVLGENAIRFYGLS